MIENNVAQGHRYHARERHERQAHLYHVVIHAQWFELMLDRFPFIEEVKIRQTIDRNVSPDILRAINHM